MSNLSQRATNRRRGMQMAQQQSKVGGVELPPIPYPVTPLVAAQLRAYAGQAIAAIRVGQPRQLGIEYERYESPWLEREVLVGFEKIGSDIALAEVWVNDWECMARLDADTLNAIRMEVERIAFDLAA